MLTQRQAAAEIRAILIAHDAFSMREIIRDFEASDFVYHVTRIFASSAMLDQIKDAFSAFATATPTVLIIDYRAAGSRCETILRQARALSQRIAIECVVLHGPADIKRRQRLSKLGATFVADEAERIESQRESLLSLSIH